ncbi:MAG TPA: copper resistance protein CopC [Actinomycetota bacterium]|nr:copper resistance protein CopC [Actinomycetota bacterium]
MTNRLLAATVVAAIAVVALPAPALAHAGFVSSTPEPGSTLGTAPGQVILTFSEPLNTRLSRAAVHEPDGRTAAGRVIADDRVIIDLTTNQPGVYEVSWTTVSVVDGHTLSGSFRFGVGVSPGVGAEGGTTDEPTGRDLLVSAGRLVEDVSLLLLFGLLLLGRLARRRPSLEWVRTPVLPVFAAALVGGLVVVLGEALVAAPSPSARAVFTYLSTGMPGWARLGRVLLEGAGVLVAWRWPRRAAPFAVGAVVALAAAGHAAAIQPRAWGIAVEAIHLVSAGLWAGGVMALALQRPPEGWRGGAGRTLLDRFTPPALASFAVTAGTGVIRGIQEVGGLAALFGSSYGFVLVAKVLVVLAMVQLSVLAWRRVAFLPKAETAAAVLAIGAAALLSAFPLPPGRLAEASEEPGPAEVSPVPAGEGLTLGSHAGPVLVGLTLQPGRPGPNELTIYVFGPEATAALPVRATVDGASLALSQCADTCRRGEVDLRGGDVVAVDVGISAGGRTTFRLPALPSAPGEELLQKTIGAMGTLTSYRLQEDLTSGLGTTVHATYAFTAPNSFESDVEQQGSTFRTVWIADARYTREGNGNWKIEHGAPAVPVPTYIWDSFRPYQDVRILGRANLGGVRTTEIAFAGGTSDLPVWFRLWVDTRGLVHRAEMRAPGHFMDHRYYDFDAPITIEPPKGASG